MANIITGGTIATPGSSAHTLSALFTRSRSYLHDTIEPYLWSNDELTGIYNELVRDLCLDFPVIEDRTTAAICAYSYLADATTITVHAAIRNIERAKIDGEDSLLTMTSRDAMDTEYPNWEEATSDTPTRLIIRGLGNHIVRLYPPALVAGTLDLDVIRGPLVDAVWATDSAVDTALGIDDAILVHGVVARALLVGDRDAEDIAKSEKHEQLYEEAIERFKCGQLRKNFVSLTAQPHPGFGT